MKSVNIHEAKTHLSRLVDAAARGESFIIAKAGKPMVKVVALTPAEDAEPLHRIGFLKGKYALPPDFEDRDREMDREIEALFTGATPAPAGPQGG